MKDSFAKILYFLSGVVWLVATLAIIGSVISFVAQGNFEEPAKPGEVKELKVPPLIGRVVDTAKVFNRQHLQTLNQEIVALEKASGGQMAILTIPSLQGNVLEDFSLKVAETWKIGHKGKDNGLILLLAIKDRRVSVEVGYGWEGDIPDAKAGDIIRMMKPYLAKGDYEGACIVAVRMAKLFTAKENVSKVRPPQNTWSIREIVLAIGFGGILAGFIIFFLATAHDTLSLEARQHSPGSALMLAFLFYTLYSSLFQLLLAIVLSSGGRGGSGGGGSYRGGGGSYGGGGASGRW